MERRFYQGFFKRGSTFGRYNNRTVPVIPERAFGQLVEKMQSAKRGPAGGGGQDAADDVHCTGGLDRLSFSKLLDQVRARTTRTSINMYQQQYT